MAIGKIICIGDSLTAGDESNPLGYRSYRGALQLLLQTAGYTVDFVGTQSSTPATGGNDPEHDGYGGARMATSDSANSIESRVSSIRTAVGAVDIIILFIGWNDVYQSTASAATKYSSLLTTIRTGTWASAKMILVTLSPEPNKTPVQTGSDYPVYSQINTQIAASAAAAPTTTFVADLAALTGSSAADRSTMVEKLLYDAANYPDATTRANGQAIPSVLGGHYITSFRSIQDYNANWRTTVPERRGGNGNNSNGLAPTPASVGHPYFVNTVDSIVPWFWVFTGPGHNSSNTVVEARNLFAQAQRGSTNNWQFFFEGARPGASDNSAVYDAGDPSVLRGYRPDGITTYYRTGGGSNIESWAEDTVPSRGVQGFYGGRDRALMADAVSFCVGIQCRLALLDPSGPNDIAASRFVVACGFDAFAGAPYRYDYWGWPYEAMDGGHDRWQILRAIDWTWVGSIPMDRGSGHYEDPGVMPPHEQGYPYAHPYNDYPTYSKSATQIRANPPKLPQYYSGGTAASNGWAPSDYWFNPGLAAPDIHHSQQGADKAARVVYDRMVSAELLTGFTGGGPIEAQLLPGIVPVAGWWSRFTTEATDPDTADWEPMGPAATAPPAWITDSLPVAVVGVAYSVTVRAGGVPAATYSIVSGAPGWLSINSTSGALTGTPTGGETSHTLVLRATNTINGVTNNVDKTLALEVRASPVVTTTTLPAGRVGDPYFQILQATGTGPFTWSVVSGLASLTARGMALSGNSIFGAAGAIVAGTASFTVRATAPLGLYDDQALTISVSGASDAPVITTLSLTPGVTGTAGTRAIAATGAATIVWSVPFTGLAGVTINASTGVLSYPAAAAGTYAITVQAANAVTPAAQTTFAFRVDPIVVDPIARRFEIGPEGGGAAWKRT